MKLQEQTEVAEDVRRGGREFGSVFHPSDFTPGDESAFLHALRIAVAARAELQLLHVRGENESVSWLNFPGAIEVLSRWGYIAPDATESDLRALGFEALRFQRVGDDPLPQIERFVNEMRPDLSVLATHQRQGIQRILRGSIAEPITRNCRALTLYVPRRVVGFVDAGTGETTLKNILIPTDTEVNARLGFQAAARIVETLAIYDAHFTFLHVGNEANMPEIQEELRWAWTSERRAWQGGVVSHILEAAAAIGADLIAMATSGHDDILDTLLGSTTEQVIRDADCPVLAVPTD
jgi:nucleotide-binding universal stress UspA family protein